MQPLTSGLCENQAAEPDSSRPTSEGHHTFDDVRDTIRTKLVETTGPSLAVAVAQRGAILWEEGFGWADREARRPADEHTLYSLASISKPITATGIMVLQERGKLDLDLPINQYLGEAGVKAWIGSVDDATVRRVANHSSGLPLHYQFFPENEPYPRPPMDETIRRYGHLVAAPGERYQYANLGYGILDYVISRISGQTYADFMRSEVFAPLGMTHTSVNVGPGLGGYAATRYTQDRSPIPFYDFDHPGASAVFASVHDLVKFGMFHLKADLADQKAILSDEAIDEMQRPTTEISAGHGYGVGWAISEDVMGYRSVSHSGGMAGVNTLLTLIPSEEIAVAVLSNASSALPSLICHEVLSTLLPEYAERRAEYERAQNEKRQEQQEAAPAFHPSDELLGKWQGEVHTYNGNLPLTLDFKASGDVHAQLGEQLWTLLNNVDFSDGWLRGRISGDIGTEDANRRAYHLHVTLKLRGDRLNGSMTAISLPGELMGNALSHWIEVERNA